MARKRRTEPDEASEYTNKQYRAQKKLKTVNPDQQPNQQNNNEETPGRPEPSSKRALRAERHRAAPEQLPPKQPNQRARPSHLRQNPPKTLTPPEQPKPRARPAPPVRQNPPKAQPPQEQPKHGDKPRQRLILKPPKLPEPPSPGLSDTGSSDSETSTCYSQPVDTYDVEPEVEAVGTLHDGDDERWGSKEGVAQFIRSQSGLDTTDWLGVRPLGKGGCGMAGLWEKRGGDGRKIKQMVIKEETHTREEWTSIKDVKKVPSEVKVMSKLNKIHCYAIPRLFNYKRYPHVYKHRMYMEYCSFNDLAVLCKRYTRFRLVTDDVPVVRFIDQSVDRQYLPEPFLWDTFYHLVEAAVVMRVGLKDDERDLEIVHRDIKPNNIFLAKENEKKGFPFYPVAKLGDFGLAVMTHDKDPLNPNRYRGPGTIGFLAPEQEKDHSRKKGRPKLASYTNIYAIGVTMFELLTLYSHHGYMKNSAFDDGGEIQGIETNKSPEYSEEIRNLTIECIRREPVHRIKLDHLRARIKSYRDRILQRYRQSDENGRRRFESDSLLHYVGNEINNMPTGLWSPLGKPRGEGGAFPDPAYPIKYPTFPDGPEAAQERHDDRIDNLVQNSNIEWGKNLARTPTGDDGESQSATDTLRSGATVEETDDESQDMELESDDESAPDFQPPAPRAPRAPASAPAPAPAQHISRKLRNDKTFGHF